MEVSLSGFFRKIIQRERAPQPTDVIFGKAWNPSEQFCCRCPFYLADVWGCKFLGKLPMGILRESSCRKDCCHREGGGLDVCLGQPLFLASCPFCLGL